MEKYPLIKELYRRLFSALLRTANLLSGLPADSMPKLCRRTPPPPLDSDRALCEVRDSKSSQIV